MFELDRMENGHKIIVLTLSSYKDFVDMDSIKKLTNYNFASTLPNPTNKYISHIPFHTHSLIYSIS